MPMSAVWDTERVVTSPHDRDRRIERRAAERGTWGCWAVTLACAGLIGVIASLASGDSLEALVIGIFVVVLGGLGVYRLRQAGWTRRSTK